MTIQKRCQLHCQVILLVSTSIYSTTAHLLTLDGSRPSTIFHVAGFRFFFFVFSKILFKIRATMELLWQGQRVSAYESLSRVSRYLALGRNMTTTGSTSPPGIATSASPSSNAIDISTSPKTREEPQEYQCVQYPYYISRSSTKAKKTSYIP